MFLNRVSSLQRTLHIPFARRYSSGTATKTMEMWMKQRQNSLSISSTTTTPKGRILDWVPILSQTEEAIASPPSELSQIVKTDLASPIQNVHFDIGTQGPADCVPILRPDLSTLTETVLKTGKQGGLVFQIHDTHHMRAAPLMTGYFHATSAQTIQAFGCEGRFGVWNPTVDTSIAKGDDHSISQIWLQSVNNTVRQTVEGGLIVKKSLNKDTSTCLFTYFTTNGYDTDGDNLGGYNRLHDGWVQVHPTLYPGIGLDIESSISGGIQYELGVKFTLFEGNWWFGIIQDNSWSWLGYYPSSLFNGGLGNSAQHVSFGGEIHSSLSNPCTTQNQMGSGRQAASGWSYAALQKNLAVQTDLNGTLQHFNGTELTHTGSNCSPNPYTIQTKMNSNGIWGSYQYFGGPTA